jgi:hypothetical protein
LVPAVYVQETLPNPFIERPRNRKKKAAVSRGSIWLFPVFLCL